MHADGDGHGEKECTPAIIFPQTPYYIVYGIRGSQKLSKLSACDWYSTKRIGNE